MEIQLLVSLIIHATNYNLSVTEGQVNKLLPSQYDLLELTIGFELKEGMTANQCHLEEYHLKYDPQQQINALKGLKERCMISEYSAYQKKVCIILFWHAIKRRFRSMV